MAIFYLFTCGYSKSFQCSIAFFSTFILKINEHQQAVQNYYTILTYHTIKRSSQMWGNSPCYNLKLKKETQSSIKDLEQL